MPHRYPLQRYFLSLCFFVAALCLQPTEALAQTISVAVYDDVGAGRSKEDLYQVLRSTEGVYYQTLNAEDFRSRDLSSFDIIICPGGSGSKQGRQLAESGRNRIRKFVSNGGSFIGICAGAYLASADYDWSLNLLDAKVVDRKHWARGTGTVRLRVSKDGQQLFGSSDQIEIYYGQGPLLAPAGRDDIPDFETLATYESEINRNGAPAGVMLGKTAIAIGNYGQGQVVCFSPHPEKTDGRESMIGDALRLLVSKNDSRKLSKTSLSVAALTSDVSQKGMPNGNYCAPCAAANLISQFASRKKIGTTTDARGLALELGDSEHMQTISRNGTNRYRLVNGLHRWLSEQAPQNELLVQYTGVRPYDKQHLDSAVRKSTVAQTGIPSVYDMVDGLQTKKGVAILFGSYREDEATGKLTRLGGHYVAVVGVEHDEQQTTIVLHDSNDGVDGEKRVTVRGPSTVVTLYSEGEILAKSKQLLQLENAPIRRDGRIAFLETVFTFDLHASDQ